MWLYLAFLSSICLGFYEIAKKRSLINNAIVPVLWCNILFSCILLSPMILSAELGLHWFDGTVFESGTGNIKAHLLTAIKSAIVLSSWLLGYVGLKHLPITIVSPIIATRPVVVLIGAMIIFNEIPNTFQWCGILVTGIALYLFSRSSQKEGINFKYNHWVWYSVGAAILGAVSGLYDKHIMSSLNPVFVQGWFNIYQFIIMSIIACFMWLPKRKRTETKFHWNWAIILVALFLAIADFAYFNALTHPGAMISVMSMIRGGSVIVSFTLGALIFHEKNIRAKALDLTLILAGLFLLYLGSR